VRQLNHTRRVPSAKSHNDLIDAIKALRVSSVAGGMEGMNASGGRSFSVPEEDEIFGVITGGSQPYQWSWAGWTPGTGWTPIAPGLSNAWEINGRNDVVAGKAFVLLPGFQGDRRFQDLRLGTPPSGCTTDVCVISPCDSSGTFNATGVTVTVSQGSDVIFQGVATGGFQCLSVPIPANGTYTVATSGNPRYNDTSHSVGLTCGGEFKVPLVAAANFVCVCFANEPVSPNLMISGGAGSAVIPSQIQPQTFTLPASVNALTADAFGTCDGTITADPCTTGTGTINVSFTFASHGCNDIQQGWTAASDCTVNLSGGAGGDGALDFYGGDTVGAGGAEQWGTALSCFGFNSDGVSVDPSFPVPQDVPLMFTVTFPPTGSTLGTAANNPPISSVVVTEVM
jgi:hypothetical protein